MAEWRIAIEHLLVFAGDEERQHYLSSERTEAERNEIRTELEELYQSIPDPTEAELKQFMGENTWRETQHNPSARDLPKAQWKGFRKAEARKRLAESKRQSSEPKTTTLGGTDEMWWGHFYISHLEQKDRDRIKRGEFEPEEIEKLAKGESPWAWHKPLPAGLQPPADAPPFEAWLQGVIEHFSAERVRQAAVDAAKGVSAQSGDHPRTPEDKRRDDLLRFMPKTFREEYDKADPDTRKMLWESNERGYEASQRRKQERLLRKHERTTKVVHSLMPSPPEKPKQLGQLAAEMAQANQPSSQSQSAKPKPYTQPKRVSKVELAKLLRGEPLPDDSDKQDATSTTPWHKHRELVVGILLATGAAIMGLVLWLVAPNSIVKVTLALIAIFGLSSFSIALVTHYLFDRLRVGICAGIIFAGLATSFLGWYVWPRTVVSARTQEPSQPSGITLKTEESSLDVDPAYLVGLYKKYNSAQADELVKSYIGKWTPPISGTVGDVTGDKKGALMTVAVKRADGVILYVAVANFNEDRWSNRALVFRPNESVTIKGKLEHVRAGGILLIDCEIVE